MRRDCPLVLAERHLVLKPWAAGAGPPGEGAADARASALGTVVS